LNVTEISSQKPPSNAPIQSLSITDTQMISPPPQTDCNLNTTSQSEETSEQPFSRPIGSESLSSFKENDLIVFGYPLYTQKPQWKIGKITAIRDNILEVIPATAIDVKGQFAYLFSGQPISISTESVISSVTFNSNGTIAKRGKKAQFLDSLGLIKTK
jgi:hypothetical protein